MQSIKQKFHIAPYQIVIALFVLCTPIMSKAQFGGGSIAIFGPTSATAGETKNYSLAAPSNITSTNWYASTGATIQSSSTFNATVNFNSAGTRQVSAVSIDIFFSFYTDDLNVSVSPGIPSNPGNPTISSNNCGQAILQRSGTPPSGVTWYWQGKDPNGTRVDKGSGSTYIADEGNGTYYIRAKSSSGWSTGSGVRSVNITSFESIDITGSQTICYGGDPGGMGSNPGATGGTSYTYRWERSDDGLNNWVGVGWATLSTYNPPGGLTADRYYRRKVTSCSGQYRYSNVVKVTVRPNLNAGAIVQPSPICYGSSPGPLTTSTPPSGGDGNYNQLWEYFNTSSNSWVYTGVNSATYDPPENLTSSRQYRKVVYSCGQSLHTDPITVTVRPSLSPGTIAGEQTRCFNELLSPFTTTASPTGGNGSYAYKWQFSNSGSSPWTDINGATSSTYNPNGTLVSDRWFRKQVTSCGQTLHTDPVKVTIDQGQTYYYDTDGDGYGNPSNSISACTQPSGTVTNSSDYDDSTILVTNLAPQTWYKDADGDGFGDNSATLTASFKRLGWATNNTDQCPNDPGSGDGCNPFSVSHSDENYVTVKSYQDDSESEAIQNVSYFDGLGRKKQDVAIRASGSASAKSPNLAPGWSMDWTVGTGSTTFFNQNGATSENSRIQAPDPFGRPATIWECGNDQSSNSDGGWNTVSINVDKTKTYRYTVWVRRNHGQEGQTYHGTQHVNNLSGSANGDPYFWNGDLPQLDTWYLLVGIIHPHTHGTTGSGVSGVYDLQGNKVDNGTDFKWRSDTTTSYFRSYLDYCTDVNVRQYFHAPVLEVVDGNELPLQKFFDDGKPKDVVTHVEYDTYGRASKQYLPYMEYGNIGAFRSGAKTATNDHYTEFYGADINSGTPNPFSETEYEASPLNRVLKQAAPGHDWRMGGGHEIEFGYQTNVADEVRFFKVTFSGGNTEAPQLTQSGYYPAKELYKKVTYDENHTSGTDHSTEEFTNKRGQVVLKRTYNSGSHDTYYVYDDFGNLTYVIPPKVTTASVSTTELNELCYQYKYDHRNRLVEKRLPGKDPEEIVYNKLDQPIMTRDANLQANSQWLFTKYDAFGRVAYTGVINSSSSRSTHQTAADGTTNQFESRVGTPVNHEPSPGVNVYYSNTAYPNTNIGEIYTVNYYDSYVDTDGLSVPTSVLGQTKATNVRGLVTGSKVRVLGTNNWITTITGYDVKGRPIYTASKNNYLNTTDIVETELDFAGKVVRTVTSHTKGSNPAIVTTDNFTYDQMARLVQQTQTLGSHTETVVENSYDELGQLVEKKVGGGLQNVDYTYNVRGWLKQINDPSNLGSDLFAFGINYNSTQYGGGPLYNGNIAETAWKTSNDNELRRYRYEYDALNRLELAAFNVGDNSQPHRYSTSNISYDKNGNILGLTRNGHTNSGATSFGTMDNLVYTYDSGNKLTNVADNNASDTYGFVDVNGSGTEYTYDLNGNMKTDANKGITGISYNHLNLPTSISINGAGGNGTISYIYDATGAKLKKTVGSSVTEYAGNHIYQNGSLQFFNHAEGYVTPDGSGGYDYVYQYKDHLGNVRLSFIDNNGTTEIVEENNYYPFGLKHKGYNEAVSPLGNSVANKWKYNGMELDESLGLETYDFGARNYDPALGRWMNIDPLAEQMRRHSPYNYAYNNPVAFIDPDGMLGQAAWASSFGISLSSMGSMFTESEAAVQRRQRQAIYDRINGVLNDEEVEEEKEDCPRCDDANILVNAVRQAAAEHGVNMANEYIANWTKEPGEFNTNEYIGEGYSYTLSQPIETGANFEDLDEDEFYRFQNDDIVISIDGETVKSDISFFIGQKKGSSNSDYNIARVEIGVHSENRTGGARSEGKVRFRGVNGKVVANLNFKTEKQHNAFWRTNFTNIRNTAIMSTLSAYDRKNGTNFMGKIKGTAWSTIE
ncbi:DUF6443 domain-containing protein [Flagellimonas sp.]|uniref:RHS repeat domain-containing protein n=1 Tax=Flagellimonas sp. TaxID=2058762 RepID=UPI003F4A2173